MESPAGRFRGPLTPMTGELGNEARLLLACARTRIDAAGRTEIRRLAAGPFDWNYLFLKAEQHQLIPLLYHNLSAICREAVPSPAIERLRARNREYAVRAMALSAELVRLLQLFEAERLEVIPYKGPALALAAYGDAVLRPASDLDVLVRREDALKACIALERRGYKPAVPLARLHAGLAIHWNQELSFDSPHGPQVDLHWSMTPPQVPPLLDFDFLRQRLVTVEVEGYPVRTLCPEDSLLCLLFPCLRHQWSSLKWLCDMAQVVDSADRLCWPEVARRASAQGYARTLRVAGSLLSSHLSVPVPPQFCGEEETAGKILRLAFSDKTAEGAVWELRRERAGLLDSRADRARFWMRLFFFPALNEWQTVALPRPLFFLYFLVRPWRLIAKYVLRLRRFA